jgi:predicted transcriptional regulator YdeE
MQISQTALDGPQHIVGFSEAIEKEHAREQIQALWARAAAAGLLASGEAVYAVYYDYQDRLAEQYRVLVGVESFDSARPEWDKVALPRGTYAVFEARGEPPHVAGQCWRVVWTQWAQASQRSFRCDFERYEGPPQDACLKLHVGVVDAVVRDA